MHSLVPPPPWPVLETSAGSLSHDIQPQHPRWSRAWWQDQWAHRGHPWEVGIITHGLLLYPYLIAIRVVAVWLDPSKVYGFKQEYYYFISFWCVATGYSLLSSLRGGPVNFRDFLKFLALLILFLGFYLEFILPPDIHMVR